MKAGAFTGSTLLTWVPQNVQKRAPGFNFLPQFVQNAISYPPYILGSNPFVTVKTRSRVLRAGFGSASADKFLSESVRILAERLTQSELVLRLR